MLLYLAFLLIIGVAIADHDHAWETGNEYHYLIKSRTLTGLDGLAQQYSGIFMRGKLTIQVKSSDTLQAVVSETQHASVNEILSDISDEITNLEYHKLSLSEKPFKLKLKRGVIRDILVDQDVPTWEVNLLKSIVSQLQIDTEGENATASKSTMTPDNQSFSEFKVMEDSVGGKCEVLYSILSVEGDDLSISLPHLHKDGQHFVIAKTKNYSRCEQRMAYHSGIVSKMNWKPGSTDGFLSRSSSNCILISGNLKRFTIQSSMMTSQILINSHYKIDKSKYHNTYSSAVYSSMNLTLDRMNQISNPMPESNNLMSTGNLVYTYNNPFSSQRRPRRPSVNQSSLAASSSENHNFNNSSEENYSDDDKSEERDYFQPKPKLDEAPESPLLPYFIGYRGMSILKSEENYTHGRATVFYQEYTQLAIRLIHLTSFRHDHQIESLPPSQINDRYIHALERFTILVRLIRTMNVEQIAEVDNTLPEIYTMSSLSKKDFDLSNQNAWDTFSCAVANAGTGPALITIKNWIKTGKLEGIQAAQIISKIPKSALAPTTEYVAAFFELITDEKVTKQRFLNTTAPLSFAELIRYTHSCNKLSTYYPVYSFGRMPFKHDHKLLEAYIPYMATQLRTAIEEGDSRRIQTYIMALGNFGHAKILSAFEPYLEGTIPISKFQRLMMVTSLSKLSESYPRVIRSVAYKIYLNLKEAYELRCAAVHIIMKTNPPLIMLQRMAEFTNQDQDRHVNSVVKTSIESLVNLEQSEWKDLADKARIASKLLNPNISDDNYSRGIFMHRIIAAINMAQTAILQTIGSDDIDTSKDVYLDVLQSYGGLNLPLSKLSYAVSSIKELKQMWLDIWLGERPWMPQNKTEMGWMIEMIIENLGIEPENAEQLEGNFFMDSAFSLGFYPFDNRTLEEFINMFKMYHKSISQTGSYVSESKMVNDLNHYDITLGFPTETGLPFIYTLAVPKITSINKGGSVKVTESQPKNVEVTAAGFIVSSEKIQSRIGFVTPFEHRHYIAGVDINTHIAIPADLNVKTRDHHTFELKIRPHDNGRVSIKRIAIHHSVVPYTSRHNILHFNPLEYDNDTRLVHTNEPNEIQFSLGNLTLSARSDVIDSDMAQMRGLDGLISIICYLNLGAHYRRFDAILYPIEAQVNLTYHHVRLLTNTSSNVAIPTTVDKRPNSREREIQFLNEVIKNNRSINLSNFVDNSVDMFDISLLANNNYYVFTSALANNYDKLQLLSYANVQSLDGEVSFEFCSANSIVGLSRYNYLNVEKAIEKIPNYEFNAEMRIGSCANGEMIKLKGNLSRTDDVMKKAMKSQVVEECRQQMKQGNIWLPTCQKANELIQQRDLLKMSIETNSDNIYSLANRMNLMIKMMIDENMKISNSESVNKNMEVEIKMPLDNNDANISLCTSQVDVSFSLSNFIEDPNVIFPNFTLNKLFDKNLEGDKCVLDKTQVVTFDDKVYPLTLGKCWHVIMAPYPKRDSNNPEKILSLPNDMRAIVMAREMDDGSKQVWIILGYDEIHLRKLDGRLEISETGGENYDSYFSSYKNYRQSFYDIYQEDGIIIMHSLKYDIHIVYDGERILLYVNDKYRYTVRGLCGNYDMQSNNDFVTPKNCILSKPEEFAATYALTYREDCEGPALQNKLKAEQSTCISRSYIPGDVISERETEKFRRNRRWGYH